MAGPQHGHAGALRGMLVLYLVPIDAGGRPFGIAMRASSGDANGQGAALSGQVEERHKIVGMFRARVEVPNNRVLSERPGSGCERHRCAVGEFPVGMCCAQYARCLAAVFDEWIAAG